MLLCFLQVGIERSNTPPQVREQLSDVENIV